MLDFSLARPVSFSVGLSFSQSVSLRFWSQFMLYTANFFPDDAVDLQPTTRCVLVTKIMVVAPLVDASGSVPQPAGRHVSVQETRGSMRRMFSPPHVLLCLSGGTYLPSAEGTKRLGSSPATFFFFFAHRRSLVFVAFPSWQLRGITHTAQCRGSS